MAQRRLERREPLEAWMTAALLGLPDDGLSREDQFNRLIDATPERLAPLWARHREPLLLEWRAMHGDAPHPMDAAAPKLPPVRR